MKTVTDDHKNRFGFHCHRYPDHLPVVLVVDDDPRVGDVLQEFLASEGFTVSYASDGWAALRQIALDPPNVVLADMKMPLMDGVTLLKEIRHRWREIDVIMMSASESPIGLRAPFLQKPFDLDDVLETICQIEH